MCQAFAAMVQQGVVYIPNDESGEDSISHLIKFPTGKYDDYADACGLLGRFWPKLVKAKSPPQDSPSRRLVGRRPLKMKSFSVKDFGALDL